MKGKIIEAPTKPDNVPVKADCFFLEGDNLAMIRFCKKRVEYRLKHQKQNMRTNLELRSYNLILESGDPRQNADIFVSTKREHLHDNKFPGNMSVIKFLKRKKLWHDGKTDCECHGKSV